MPMRQLFPKFPTLRRLFSSKQQQPLSNEAIRSFPRVRLISQDGRDCGIMSGREAFNQAKTTNMDLLLVAQSETPVVRVADYAAYDQGQKKKNYERRKAKKEKDRLNRKETILKQLRLSPSTDTHDLSVKIRQARHFLTDGHRVKMYMQFRRGQGRLQDVAKSTLIGAAEQLADYGTVQALPAAGLADIFKLTREQEEQGIKPPLQILMRPLSRKAREQLQKQNDHNLVDNVAPS